MQYDIVCPLCKSNKISYSLTATTQNFKIISCECKTCNYGFTKKGDIWKN